MKNLISEEKEIFRVIKTLRQNYIVDDFLKAIHRIKNQENTKTRKVGDEK